jgi:hypothetical protein
MHNIANVVIPRSKCSKRPSKRRSISSIPKSNYKDLFLPQFEEVNDGLRHIRIVPRPTKTKYLRPTLSKFLKGKSSLYSVAAALTRVHQNIHAKNARIKQCLFWGMDDKKLYKDERNAHYKIGPPDLPKSLGVKLNCCRAAVAGLIDLGFIPFSYSDYPKVFLFMKMQDNHRALDTEHFNHLVKYATLNSATVAVFVGCDNTSTLPERKGLGTLYFSNGNIVSGDAALAMRVARSVGEI